MEKIDEGFGGGLGFGNKPALVSIDLMLAYFDPSSPMYLPSRDCLESSARVIAAARKNNVPVIHTRVIFGPDAVDGAVFIRKIPALKTLIGDNPMNRFMPEVAPLDNELVIVKQYASAFFGTSLSSTLRGLGVDTLAIIGVSTSGCIRATGLDALQNGFIPIVVRDACGDRAPGPHESNLYDLQAKYAEVISESQVIAGFDAYGSR